MVRRYLLKSEVEKEPYLIWNSFIDLLVTEEYTEFDEVQRVAYLCFWYDSEMQNGGHLQYFENQGLTLLNDTISALNKLGAAEQSDILMNANSILLAKPRRPIESVDQYVERALEGEFDELDDAYYNCTPDVTALLEKYLEQYRDYFVIINLQ